MGTRPSRAVVLGGDVRRDELSCVGPAARATLERYRFDLAGWARRLTARWGLTDLNDEEAEIHRVAIERSERLMVIADGSKIGQAASAMVAPAQSIHPSYRRLRSGGAADALSSLGMTVVVAVAGNRGGRKRTRQRRPEISIAPWTASSASRSPSSRCFICPVCRDVLFMT